MNITSIRSSSYSTYMDCNFKYYLLYDINAFPSISGKSAHLGSVVHWVNETLAKYKFRNRHLNTGKFAQIPYLVEIAYKRYQKMYPDIEWTPKEDLQFCNNQVKVVLDSVYHPYKLNVIGTEKQFQLEIKLPGFELGEDKYVLLRGTIDLVTESDPDTLQIIDYKTGKRSDWVKGHLKDCDTLRDDMQFRIYDLAGKILYPKYKHRMYTMFFTADGGPQTTYFEDNDHLETIDRLREFVSTVKNDTKLVRLRDDPAQSHRFFNCLYVCQFRWIEVPYTNGKETIVKQFRWSKYGYPDSVEENNKKYTRVDGKYSSVCDKYYDIIRKNGPEKAAPILYNQVTVDPAAKVSKRNNYAESSKIVKGIIS